MTSPALWRPRSRPSVTSWTARSTSDCLGSSGSPWRRWLLVSVLVRANLIYEACATLGRRVYLFQTPTARPAGPPLEKLAADLRRLHPEARTPEPGVRVRRQQRALDGVRPHPRGRGPGARRPDTRWLSCREGWERDGREVPAGARARPWPAWTGSRRSPADVARPIDASVGEVDDLPVGRETLSLELRDRAVVPPRRRPTLEIRLRVEHRAHLPGVVGPVSGQPPSPPGRSREAASSANSALTSRRLWCRVLGHGSGKKVQSSSTSPGPKRCSRHHTASTESSRTF